MNKVIEFPVKPIIQPESECAPACLAMVLSYFKKSWTMNEIIKAVPKDSPKWRDWLYWLGSLAIKKGLAAEMITMSTQTFDMSWQKLSQKKLLEKLKEELQFNKKVIQTKKEPYANYFQEHHSKIEKLELEGAIQFLKNGGTIKIIPTTSRLIEQALMKKSLAIASLDASILYRSKRGLLKDDDIKGTTWGHVVVINGCKGNTFSIVDPANWYKKNQKFSILKEYLIESILRRDQNLLLLKNIRVE